MGKNKGENKNTSTPTPAGIDRRGFMKLMGAGAAGAALAGIGGCGSGGPPVSRAREVPTDKMTYRVDPKNGNKLSLLGFGMMRLPRVPRRRGESLPDVNDLDQDAVNELVAYALAHGVNLFDTSPVYCKGFSETATGIALEKSGVPRGRFFVSTKMSNSRPAGAEERETSLKLFDRSLENLRVDYIDYYFAHNVGSREAFKKRYIDNGILDFMFKEKEKGRVKNIGWSFHGDGEFFEYLANEYPWDFTMIQLNYLDWGFVADESRTNIAARRQYEILLEKETPIWIMEPLLGGGLAMPHYKARERMTQADPEGSAASWAFRFAGSLPGVTTVLSGMMFMDHLQDNIRTYSPLVPLTDAEREMLTGDVTKIIFENRNINCTKCQYCMPCPYGIDIPEIFAHYNRSMNEGNYPDDRERADYRKARRAFLVGMDRSVSPIRQASRCINCGQCVSGCPQRINIPKEMMRIDAFAERLKMEV